jgi:sulfate-transporting ATPase
MRTVAAVDDVSFEVRPGEVHGLIGPNGAGKTTVVDAVTGFVRPSAGTARLADRDLNGLNARRRARAGMARSFQSLELFSDLTIRENLAVAGDDGRASRYLTDLVRPGAVQLSDAAIAAVREFDLADHLDEKPNDLSFGRRRLVGIARAIAAAPSILLLDEPASGLDDIESRELAALIRRLADDWGMGILLIEHNTDLVLSVSDRVTVLAGGRVLMSGPPDEVRSDPAVRAVYLGSVRTAVTDPAETAGTAEASGFETAGTAS